MGDLPASKLPRQSSSSSALNMSRFQQQQEFERSQLEQKTLRLQQQQLRAVLALKEQELSVMGDSRFLYTNPDHQQLQRYFSDEPHRSLQDFQQNLCMKDEEAFSDNHNPSLVPHYPQRNPPLSLDQQLSQVQRQVRMTSLPQVQSQLLPGSSRPPAIGNGHGMLSQQQQQLFLQRMQEVRNSPQNLVTAAMLLRQHDLGASLAGHGLDPSAVDLLQRRRQQQMLQHQHILQQQQQQQQQQQSQQQQQQQQNQLQSQHSLQSQLQSHQTQRSLIQNSVQNHQNMFQNQLQRHVPGQMSNQQQLQQLQQQQQQQQQPNDQNHIQSWLQNQRNQQILLQNRQQQQQQNGQYQLQNHSNSPNLLPSHSNQMQNHLSGQNPLPQIDSLQDTQSRVQENQQLASPLDDHLSMDGPLQDLPGDFQDHGILDDPDFLQEEPILDPIPDSVPAPVPAPAPALPTAAAGPAVTLPAVRTVNPLPPLADLTGDDEFMAEMPPLQTLEGSACSRRLLQFMYHQRRRPASNSIDFWQRFVNEYFTSDARKRWCVSSYDNAGRQPAGAFPQNVWDCQLCAASPGKGFEMTVEVLPRLFKVKYDSGVLDELLFVDVPNEYELADGVRVLEYNKAVQESVFEELRVVRTGRLRVLFRDLKIMSWELCTHSHEELISRRNVLQQVGQLAAVAHKCQTINLTQVPAQHLQLQFGIRMANAARQLVLKLDAPAVNDLGFTKSYVRCLQISEVVNSMKDLIDYSLDNNLGPLMSLRTFPRRVGATSSLAEKPPPLDAQRLKRARDSTEFRPPTNVSTPPGSRLPDRRRLMRAPELPTSHSISPSSSLQVPRGVSPAFQQGQGLGAGLDPSSLNLHPTAVDRVQRSGSVSGGNFMGNLPEGMSSILNHLGMLGGGAGAGDGGLEAVAAAAAAAGVQKSTSLGAMGLNPNSSLGGLSVSRLQQLQKSISHGAAVGWRGAGAGTGGAAAASAGIGAGDSGQLRIQFLMQQVLARQQQKQQGPNSGLGFGENALANLANTLGARVGPRQVPRLQQQQQQQQLQQASEIEQQDNVNGDGGLLMSGDSLANHYSQQGGYGDNGGFSSLGNGRRNSSFGDLDGTNFEDM